MLSRIKQFTSDAIGGLLEIIQNLFLLKIEKNCHFKSFDLIKIDYLGIKC